MIAILLAAGVGRRFGLFPFPKPLIKIWDKTIIEHSLDAISKAGIKKAIIIVGYLKDKVKEKLGNSYNDTEIKYAENNDFFTTNTMYSFYSSKDLIDDDVLLLDGDLLYDFDIIKKIQQSEYKNFLVVSERLNRGEALVSSRDKISVENIGSKENVVGEFFGISKLSQEFIKKLFDFYEKNQEKMISCEEGFLRFSKESREQLSYLPLDKGLLWADVDYKEDIEKVKNLFKNENNIKRS